jgi:DNA invertase Pin-like site-specific DNA recombinase
VAMPEHSRPVKTKGRQQHMTDPETPETRPTILLVGYARVSREDQNLDLQFDALRAAGVSEDMIYHDKATGAHMRRAGLMAMMKHVRAGTTVVLWRLDRLGRSVGELISTAMMIDKRGGDLKTLADGGWDTRTAMGRFLFHILAALAEFERGLVQERTRAGMAAARLRGKIPGRRIVMTPEKLAEAKALLLAGELSHKEIAARLQVSIATFTKHATALKEEIASDQMLGK